MKGKGLGRELLAHALMTTLQVAEKAGVFLVVVDAKNEAAVTFYKKYGFVQLVDAPQTLVLPVSAIPK